ncbi:MAG: hypothetical protein ACRD5Z_20780, partial [Bryobacteraceae bacterium]
PVLPITSITFDLIPCSQIQSINIWARQINIGAYSAFARYPEFCVCFDVYGRSRNLAGISPDERCLRPKTACGHLRPFAPGRKVF